jgi:hypothetical protein
MGTPFGHKAARSFRHFPGDFMDCKYLTGTRIAQCMAMERLMVPSIRELQDFCRSEPSICPVYQAAQAGSRMADASTSGSGFRNPRSGKISAA